MRFLVGAACVAVIVFVGYYFWNEYSRAQAISQAAKAQEIRTEQARAELFRLANADRGEISMVRAWCKLAEMRTTDGQWENNDHMKRAVQNCRALNYL